MFVLIGIGLLAGFVTVISPCVLPVLPILLAGGASGRKPLRIIAGLVGSFVIFTLFATWLLDSLGLPDDLLRNLAIALLFVLAATLLVPRLAVLLERPFTGLTRFRAGGGGFWLGVSLGLVFVPCAGPVLAAVVANAARHDIGVWTVLTVISYAIGAAIPMLVIATGGREVAQRLRSRAPEIRALSGVLIAAVALGLSFHFDDRLTTAVPGYLDWAQSKIEQNHSARHALQKLSGTKPLVAKTAPVGAGLPDYGAAPALKPDGQWFNSPPLTLAGLHGKTVLIDFWTYSCINCLRTLPHLKAWYAAYHRDGLEIIGVHTPEFAFEHVASNVGAAVKRLGIPYPVVQDNKYGTWDAFQNQYWPAEYLIDSTGQIRHVNFGEGKYDETEAAIKTLVGAPHARATDLPNTAPTDLVTPETYLGSARLDVTQYAGSALAAGKVARYTAPVSLPQNAFAYTGSWRIEPERIVAGKDAGLLLHIHAKDVYLVLGGQGRVKVSFPGSAARNVDVNSYRLYTLRSANTTNDGLLGLKFSPGLQAYAFTFG